MEIFTTITAAVMHGAPTAALLTTGAALCALVLTIASHSEPKQVSPSLVEGTDRRFGRTRGGYPPMDVLRTCEPRRTCCH